MNSTQIETGISKNYQEFFEPFLKAMEAENSDTINPGENSSSDFSAMENSESNANEERKKQLLRENWVAKAARYRLSAQMQKFVKDMTESPEICELAQCQFLPLQERKKKSEW